MSNKRLYTEKEISTILKRSGERQAEQGEKETQGLSLEEIQQIAGEVGLDPTIVASVASELEMKLGHEKSRSKLGLPSRVETERVIPGTVSEDLWPEIVAGIENTLGVIGASGQVGKMLEWTYTSKLVQYKVTCTPVEGQTKVRVFGNFTTLSRVLLFPFLAFFTLQGIIIPLTTGVSLWAGAAIGLSIALLVYMLVRFGFTSYLRRKERIFEQMITSLTNKVPVHSEVTSVKNAENTPSIAQVELPERETQESTTPSSGLRRKVN